MDFSSASSQQQQQQQQQFQQAGYDPSQTNQSCYYPTYYQHYQNPPQMQDFSSYYDTLYVNGHDHHHQQQFSQTEFASPVIQPPGVPARSEVPLQPAQGGDGPAPGVAVLGMESGQVQDQQHGYYPLPPGLNPAAAAAVTVLAQIVQLAGTLGDFQGPHWPVVEGSGLVSGPGPVPATEFGYYGPRPMYPLGGRSLYRGGGRRRGSSFRGKGLANIGNHPPRTGGSFHEMGQVQGKGGSGDLQKHRASSSHSEQSAAAAAEKVESKGEVAEHLAGNNEEEAKGAVQPQTPGPPSGNTVANQKPTQGARCELCKVDCNSLEILEQHKNGKRHQKNLRRSQLLENANNPGAGKCKEKPPSGDSNPEMAPKPEITKKGEENKDNQPENLPKKVVGDDNKMEIQQSNDHTEKPHSFGNAQSDCLVSQPGNQRHNLKRKMKGVRHGKRVKTADAPKGLLKPHKPKIVIPFICDLCNIRCDTKEVFDRHLSGKKHISKLKRLEAHQAMYGPVGLQALYPPSSIAQNLFHQQGPQNTFYSPQGSYPPLRTDMPPPCQNAIAAATGTVSGLVHNPSPQMSNGTPVVSYPNALFDTRQKAALDQPEPKQDS